MERDIVSDHQHGYVNDRDDVGSAELSRQRGQTDPDGVVIVDKDVGGSDEIEGDDEEPEERTHSCREERKHGQYSSYKIAIGCKGSKARGQVGADDAWKNEDEPEEAEAVHRGDDPQRLEPAHRSEFGQDIDTEAKQARDIAQDEVDGE